MLMKKVTFFALMLFSASAIAQTTFSDDFDSYTAGSYLGPQSGGEWTTWSNAPGTAEDVMVSDADAASMPNSLYFMSTASTGGPTDLVRNFGVMNTGSFTLEFNMKVVNGKAGYFNLQRNPTIGDVWAMDANFNDDGTLSIVNQSGLSFSTTYPQGTWFNFRIEIDFNTNHWEIFIDNVSQGYFANTENQVASIDIFPVDQNSPYGAEYFIDDFATSYTSFTAPALNAAVSFVGYDEGNIAGNNVIAKYRIRNLGQTNITSADVQLDYNGTQLNDNLTSLNIAPDTEQEFSFATPVTLAAGINDMMVTVSNVNGNGMDDFAGDDTGMAYVNPVVPAAGKMVVGEEATGTWCGWCPRGAVYMDMMENKYGQFWAGIAVHNADPMVVAAYDAGIGGMINGYPSALVDRGGDIDPSGIENPFMQRLTEAPVAFVTNGATYDAGTRELKVSVSYDFQAAASNNYRVICVLTEDGVSGTAAGYGQTNYYAGGGNGEMGGYESLPSPVPASQMVYDHVARAIAPSFTGGSPFPAVINAGDVLTENFTFTLPAGWDETEMHIIGMLVAPDGRINNAGKATIPEAVANGYVEGTLSVGSITPGQPDAALSLYPNPASDYAVVNITLPETADATLTITDMTGKTVAVGDYKALSGSSTVELNTAAYNAGVYFVSLTFNGEKITQKLIVK